MKITRLNIGDVFDTDPSEPILYYGCGIGYKQTGATKIKVTSDPNKNHRFIIIHSKYGWWKPQEIYVFPGMLFISGAYQAQYREDYQNTVGVTGLLMTPIQIWKIA